MVSLLQRWLDHYDPIHRGWTPSGIANGACATSGYFFPRIKGGYNLRRAKDAVPGQSDSIVGAAGADAEAIHTFAWVGHEADTAYYYRLTAVGGGGVENWDDELVTVAKFDQAGDWIGALPNGPADLRISPLAGGKFSLKWTYTRRGEQAEPDQFRIYNNSGSGSVDFDNVVATVAYRRGRFNYSYESQAFDDGTRVFWAVRAVSAAGAEEDNENVVFGWADAAAPPINPVVILTGQ